MVLELQVMVWQAGVNRETIDEFDNISDFNNKEFEVFKSIDFKFATPVAVEAIYNIIQKQLSSYNKELLFEFSLDLLRVVYLTKRKIYDMSVPR